ncbi:30S ribosomal protein S20 [Mesomycoplasma neurolyticum]|uniref:Small ribosomal subunit protein bS20 n=1 Tax=Mesomycoplasma neurolyticum TaxID=2120 RepID=A0A449A6B3_9BACT|nr:30S ribosomal protein S20 [Mesomycoplasma neurolyticum]VEU59776.1 30S ribosomal protein S20 [Mesomycoplasma neurolyticum]
MANIKSKIKRIKTNEKSRVRNAAIKSRLRKAIKKAKLAIVAKQSNAQELVSKAHKEVNTAVSKGVLHRNNGSRKISRLDLFVNKNLNPSSSN